MIEVEKKYRITPEKESEIAALLSSKNTQSVELHQNDVVFLFQKNSFKEFKRGEPTMRIRSVNGTTKLTYKRMIDSEGNRIEHELGVDSASVAELLLKDLGYQEAVRVEKHRREYQLDNAIITIDQVKNLGSFIEIEVLASSEDQISHAQEIIKTLAIELGLTDSMIETKKYDELMSEKQ